MGVVMKTIEKLLNALVNEGVMRNVVGPIRELRLVGKLAVKNQVGGLDVSAFFSEFLDGITAVTQDALITVDVSYFAGTRSCVGEGGVVAHHAEVFAIYFNRPQVESANGVVLDGKFKLPARPVVRDAERLPTANHGFGLGRTHSLTLSGRSV